MQVSTSKKHSAQRSYYPYHLHPLLLKSMWEPFVLAININIWNQISPDSLHQTHSRNITVRLLCAVLSRFPKNCWEVCEVMGKSFMSSKPEVWIYHTYRMWHRKKRKKGFKGKESCLNKRTLYKEHFQSNTHFMFFFYPLLLYSQSIL